jgi:cytochrome c2
MVVLKFKSKCINYGCKKPQANSGQRLRPTCGHCHTAGYKGTPYAQGVTPFKTGRCSNQDGHLGFVCAINYKKAPWAVGITEIDHIDGNHLNNVLKNVDELCPMCHKMKGKIAGDYQGYRYA